MNGHPEFLELIATSIDFDLTDEEFGRLSTHLARCPECRRAAEELRGDATAIEAYPAPRLAPARSEQILRAALRTPRTQPRWGMLAVAAMLTTIGGGILFAGFQLVNNDDPAPSEAPPSLVAEASTPPSAEPAEETSDPVGEPPDDGGPRVTPNPGDESAAPIEPVELAFPVPYSPDLGPIRVAPAPDDRLWVAFTRNNDTVLALLDGSGAPLRGWPVVMPNASDCLPLAAPDGSVRLSCYYAIETGECSDGFCGEDRLFAFDAAGDPLPGFPVSFPFGGASGVDRQSARMVGGSVVLTALDGSDDGDPGVPNERWIAEIRSNGNMVLGVRVPAPQKCCVIGPNGVAYGSSAVDEDAAPRTELVAFDAHGMRPGWPIIVDGSAVSQPSFGPNGQVVYSSWIDDGSRIARFNPDGSEAASSLDLPFSLEWAPEADGPLAPLADEGGRLWVVAEGEILGFDEENLALPGFPYEAETGLAVRGACPPLDTGCQSWLEPPVVAPGSRIYALENPPEGKGERITVVNRDGSIRSGWPKTLQRAGAAWRSVTIGENRLAYAVAIEPEPNNESSISILAFAPNGTREWIRTIVEP
jgi:hypothetical protein